MYSMSVCVCARDSDNTDSIAPIKCRRLFTQIHAI